MHPTEQIWREHQSQLLEFIRQRVETADRAEDILQTIFLRIHAQAHSLGGKENLPRWLYRVTRNAIVDHYRARKRFVDLPESLSDKLHPPDEEMLDLTRCVRPLIQSLPETYRLALEMSELDGLPLSEVAARLKLSLPGAKSRVQRGRRLLKTRFLDCCSFELDKRGKAIAWTPKRGCSTPLRC